MNRKPWRLLKSQAPPNEPPTTWFNAVTTVLVTLGVRPAADGEEGGVERPNTNGSGWNIVVPRTGYFSGNVHVQHKDWVTADFTGTESDYLRVYFDAVTPPAYASDATKGDNYHVYYLPEVFGAINLPRT